ncbi:MAG: hypothetical protein GY862_19575 [Gammaproteobacteria bacterium]|nr:hypothetical protein [Gammaproteobacteria bacterium]
MNVKIEISLDVSPSGRHEEQARNIAEHLADDKSRVMVFAHPRRSKMLVAEFTIKKARQIDVVDKIGKSFWDVEDYNDSSIAFPATRTKKRK